MMRYFYCFFILSLILACKAPIESNSVASKEVASASPEVTKFLGETMGTYYNIRISPENPAITKRQLDSLLVAINQELSTYIPNSTISLMNKSGRSDFRYNKMINPHFIECYLTAKTIADYTKYNFDPTINPLVNFWGFGYDKEAFAQKDTTQIPELLKKVGFHKWTEYYEGDSVLVIKKPADATLTFSAIAKGYGVDIVGRYLKSKGSQNFLVDIGGEVTASGRKSDGSNWVIGINTPREGAAADEAEILMIVDNESVATSGNYRNFYVENGEKFSHIISTRTGKPERTKLLSATVVSKDCSKADAIATAIMVSKMQVAQRYMSSEDAFEAFFIYLDEEGNTQTWSSQNFDWRIVQ